MDYIDMDIQVTPVNFNASQDLISHMKDYFKKLTKYNDQITSMDVFMESISDEKDDKLVKLKILAPGHELYLQSNKGDFVTAAQDVYDRMKRQLIDQKERDKENHQNRPDKVY
ncbi:HPF/RaiA family ribosome-associated protein [Ekhidna sp.]|uniref:HPF/RaiA family ribosome-associated protein n=1 Tax=Ekhidna sp. TaxID=2608089 RepID=UPI003C7B5A2C